MRYVSAFLRFWYDFVVGDDVLLAAVAVAAIGATALIVHAGVNAWWLTPVVLVAVLWVSLSRAAGRPG